jgi:predicted amidohydrolase YtcJ
MRAPSSPPPFLILALTLALLDCAARPVPPADLVFRGGNVYTADATRPFARAVAVRAGRIIYVGDDSGASRLIGERTRAVELGSGMLLPGLIDSHVHLAESGAEHTECDLALDSTHAQIATHIRECASSQPTAAWIRGHGWELPVFPGANPRREFLDSLVPDRPAIFVGADGHNAWVNSRALSAAGITRQSRDPVNGRIERDTRTGEPSGTLRESAIGLISRVVPPREEAEWLAGARYAIALANSFGITTAQEASANERNLRAYRTLDDSGQLSLRLVAAIRVNPQAGLSEVARLDSLRSRFTHGRVRAISAKIFADGVIEGHTSALLEPYLDTKNTGPANLSPGLFDTLVTALDRAGYQVHVHAIGDRAVRMALDAVQVARAANGPRDARHMIAHLEMIDTLDVPRFKALGVYANFQPLWSYRDSYIRDLTEPVLGPERSSRLYPIGSLQGSGAVVVAGSDWSVTSMNPLLAIQVGVTRSDPGAPAGPPWLPRELMTLTQMLNAYTINGARANFEENETGSIAVGKAADLVLLDRDLFAIPASEIAKTNVRSTYLDGKEIYTRH